MGCTACKEENAVQIFSQGDSAVLKNWQNTGLIIVHHSSDKEKKVLKETADQIKELRGTIKNYEIRAGDNQFGQVPLRAYLDAVKDFSLEGLHFKLGNTQIGTESLKNISQTLQQQRNIQHFTLNIAKTKVSSNDVKMVIENLVQPLRVLNLNFSNTGISDKSYETLQNSVGKCSHLKQLNLICDDTEITSNGINSICALLNQLHNTLINYKKDIYQFDINISLKNVKGVKAQDLKNLAKSAIACNPSMIIDIHAENSFQNESFGYESFLQDIVDIKKDKGFTFSMYLRGCKNDQANYNKFNQEKKKCPLDVNIYI